MQSSNAKNATRTLLLLLLANAAVMTALFAVKPKSSTVQTLGWVARGQMLEDSSAFMQKAWRVERAGLPVYRTVFFEEHLKFQYPMSSLLLGYVAETLHVSWAALVKWMVLLSAVLTLWLAGDIFVRLMPLEPPDRWKARLLVAGLGVSFYPLVVGVYLGQMQTVLTLLFTLAVWLWMQQRKAAAGACLALACAVKPPLGLFLVWGLLRLERRFVWSFVAVALAVQGAAIALFGWSNEVGYLAALSAMGHSGENIGENQSVNGWLQRLLRNGEADATMFAPYNAVVYAGTVVSSVALVAAGLALPVWLRWKDRLADFVVFGLLSTMASPIVWTHHYGVFYAGCVYFVAMRLRQGSALPAGFAVCFLALANYFHVLGKFYWTPSMNWVFSYVLYAGLGVVGWSCFGLRHGEDAEVASDEYT